MSGETTYPHSAILEDSFFAVCASWPDFARRYLGPAGMTYQREPRPIYGALRITILLEKQTLATLVIRAATTDRVFLSMTKVKSAPEGMYNILLSFIAWRLSERDRFNQMTPAIISGPISIATPAAPHPLDAALADYEQRRASGEMISLKDIADERKLSYSSLRKRHAAQKRTKPEQNKNK
jgi:hypothetical protein